MTEFDFEKETTRLLSSIGEERLRVIWDYEYCELDPSFVGFINNYASLDIPKDFTIVDIGCYQAVQADYFKDHRAYIGVEPSVPPKYRLPQDNAVYYQQTAQEFVEQTLPCLIERGLDLNKTFAICSAVPDEKAQRLVAETFPYHRVTYPDRENDLISEAFPPSKPRTKEKDFER